MNIMTYFTNLSFNMNKNDGYIFTNTGLGGNMLHFATGAIDQARTS